jgi:group I intron endonuclease
LIAFLGYLNSPKWSNFKYNYNNNINKTTFSRNQFNVIQKRYNSSISYTNINTNSEILQNFIKENCLTPVYTYENLQLNETRKNILKDTKGLSGIYLILNKVTLDFYIGSASTNRFYARFSNHLIYFSGSKIIKHAVKKYKIDNFAFIIIELFPDIVNKENNKNLLNREDFYLKSLLPNYNILTEAGSTFGYKHTEIDRLKMKANYSLERRLRIGNLNKEKNLSRETIEKMREKALNREKRKFSKEAILNMKKNSKPIILYNLNYTVFGEYSSIRNAADSINCNEKTIRRALATKKKILKRRWIVEYSKI